MPTKDELQQIDRNFLCFTDDMISAKEFMEFNSDIIRKLIADALLLCDGEWVVTAPVLDSFTLRESAKMIRKNADELGDDYILYYLYSVASNLELKAREIEMHSKRKIHIDMESSIIGLFMSMAMESLDPDLYQQAENIANVLSSNRNLNDNLSQPKQETQS